MIIKPFHWIKLRRMRRRIYDLEGRKIISHDILINKAIKSWNTSPASSVISISSRQGFHFDLVKE